MICIHCLYDNIRLYIENQVRDYLIDFLTYTEKQIKKENSEKIFMFLLSSRLNECQAAEKSRGNKLFTHLEQRAVIATVNGCEGRRPL